MDWLDAFREHLTTVEFYDLNPPATLEAITAVENAVSSQQRAKDFRFPASYKAFLLHHDGGNVYDNWEDEEENEDEEEGGGWIDVRFLNIGETSSPGMDFMGYNASDSVLMNHGIETYYNFEPLVIFAADTGSNFWGFDPRQTEQDGEMPIRFCDHESGGVYEQSDSFVSFIEGLTSRKVKVGSSGTRLPDVAG